MASEKKSSFSKRSQFNMPSAPLNLGGIRRSSRVSKRSADSGAPSSPERLIEAAHMLQNNTTRSNANRQGKRVSFEPPQPQPLHSNRVANNHHQQDPHSFLRHARQGSWEFPQPRTNNTTISGSASVPPPSHPISSNPMLGDSMRQPHDDGAAGGAFREGVSRSGTRSLSPVSSTRATSGEPGSVPTPATSRNTSTSDDTSCIECPVRRQKVRNLLSQEVAGNVDAVRGMKRPLDDHHINRSEPTMNPMKRRKGFVPDYTRTIPDDPIEYMLSGLREHPHEVTIGQISRMFMIIQSRILGSQSDTVKGFCEKYFDFTLTNAQREAWPLHELMTKHIPLFMTTRYIADGSQYGWRNFFTQPDSRQHLVAAIIGEWVTQRVFKHTAFGFPKHLNDILEEKDREFLHYDAVVRSKERAKLMQVWYADMVTLMHINDTTSAAADVLAEELLTVIHSLLPPPLFDPLDEGTALPQSSTGGDANNDKRKDSIPLRKTQQQKDLRAAIKQDLVSLILDCASLHKAIRLTGIDGTIVRLCPTPERGSPFHQSAPMQCVNPDHCNATHPKTPASTTNDTRLLIKMTCFPRVEAVVPSGPDMLELEFYESEYRGNLNLEAKVQSQSGTDFSHNVQEFDWDDYEHHWPIVPDMIQDDEGRNPGKLNPETNYVNTVKRASYVTVYQALCPALVYCEWTPPQRPSLPRGGRRSNSSLLPSLSSNRYQPKTNPTLTEAVHLARDTHPARIALHLETLQISLWNNWAVYGGLAQWGILSSALLVGICRYFRVPSHLQTLIVRLHHAVRDGNTIRRVAENTDHYMRELYEAIGPFGPAITGPAKDLFVDPVLELLGLERGDGTMRRTIAGTAGQAGPVTMQAGVNVPVSRSLNELLTDDTGSASLVTAGTAARGFAAFVAAWAASLSAAGFAPASVSIPPFASGFIDAAAGGPTAAASPVGGRTPVGVGAATSTRDIVMEDVGATRQTRTVGRDSGDGEIETGMPVLGDGDGDGDGPRFDDWIVRLRRVLRR